MSTVPTILTNVDARGVATLTLNRPERNNAYNEEMLRALRVAVHELQIDASVRVVVVRGSGKHFQAGADLTWVESLRSASWRTLEPISRLTLLAFHELCHLSKPTVALVHGGCFGGGTGIATACDVVVASRDAMFGITEARWGLVVTPVMPQLIARLGAGRARRYAMTCERFGAERAYEIGFIDEVCDEGQLDDASGSIVDALLHCPPEALAQTKAVALEYGGLDLSRSQVDGLVQPHALKRMSAEAEEGLASFLERRPPRWYIP